MKKSRHYIYLVLLLAIFTTVYIYSIVYTISKQDSGFMHRAWSWTEYIVVIFALVVIMIKHKSLKLNYIFTGILLSGISFLSFYERTDITTAVTNTSITLITFVGGCMLSDNKIRNKSELALRDYKAIPKALLWGMLIALPFAIINLVYFRSTFGATEYMNPLNAAFLALQPGISEEIIFRFFIMNAIFYLLEGKIKIKHAVVISFIFGIVPHSLIHFSELWLVNVPSAIFMLLSTSLLFGLPMAYLQYKRNLETAIAFHWFIDFARFFVGY